MCRKIVILFNCGHTRKDKDECCNSDGIVCAEPQRVLIPQGGGIGIQYPIDKVKWNCAFKCVPYEPAHDPLIDLAKEDADLIKANIEHQVEILSVLSTPIATPTTRSGSGTPSSELSSFDFDRRFATSVSRRLERSGLTSTDPAGFLWNSVIAGPRPSGPTSSPGTGLSSAKQSPQPHDWREGYFKTNTKSQLPHRKVKEASAVEEVDKIVA